VRKFPGEDTIFTMKTFTSIAIVCAIGALAGLARADKIVMKDGTEREGVIVDQSPTELRLKIDDGGLQATITISMDDVSSIEKGPVKAPAAPTPRAVTTIPAPTTSAPPRSSPPSSPSTGNSSVNASSITTLPAGTMPATTSSLPPTRGFLVEFGASIFGNGPGSITRLPQDLQDLWKNAQQLDAAGKKAAELEALRKLEEAFRNANALPRLDALCQKERGQPFGLWMATVHYDVIGDHYQTGIFDLSDIRDIERPALIGLMKEKTGPALEPLKTYFPPVNDKTGKADPFKPAQLSGITVDNCLDTKDKAEFAHALLLGQMKLEPQMSPADHLLLYGQLTNVGHVLTRCADLLPAALVKAQQDKNKQH